MNATKKELKKYCHNYVDQRIASIRKEINALQAASTEETKSSVGDKYETGRAMMHLEIEKNAEQLAEAIRLKQVVDQLNNQGASATVQHGSLVLTDQGNLYFAISAGTVEIDGEKYITASMASPIGNQCRGLSKGDSFTMNNKRFTIQEVY